MNNKIARNDFFQEGRAYTPNDEIAFKEVPYNKCVKQVDFDVISDQHENCEIFYVMVKNETNQQIKDLNFKLYYEYGGMEYYVSVPISLPNDNKNNVYYAVKVYDIEYTGYLMPRITFEKGSEDYTFPSTFKGNITMNDEQICGFMATYVDNGEGSYFEVEGDEISKDMFELINNLIIITINE